MLHFQIEKDDNALLSDYKYQLLNFLIRDIIRHVPDKRVTDTDAWHAQGEVMVKKYTRIVGNTQGCENQMIKMYITEGLQ